MSFDFAFPPWWVTSSVCFSTVDGMIITALPVFFKLTFHSYEETALRTAVNTVIAALAAMSAHDLTFVKTGK